MSNIPDGIKNALEELRAAVEGHFGGGGEQTGEQPEAPAEAPLPEGEEKTTVKPDAEPLPSASEFIAGPDAPAKPAEAQEGSARPPEAS